MLTKLMRHEQSRLYAKTASSMAASQKGLFEAVKTVFTPVFWMKVFCLQCHLILASNFGRTYTNLGLKLRHESCSQMLAWADFVLQHEP